MPQLHQNFPFWFVSLPVNDGPFQPLLLENREATSSPNSCHPSILVATFIYESSWEFPLPYLLQMLIGGHMKTTVAIVGLEDSIFNILAKQIWTNH